jgi:membrane fusion protein, copper/silver efflux system
MSKIIRTAVGALALVAVGAGGYRIGAGAWPEPTRLASRAPNAPAAARDTTHVRRVLYWRHPDAPQYSPNPTKADDGRDYVPVYDDEEPRLAGDDPAETATDAKRETKILYYRNPMGLPDTSPVPKKDWMGMDYLPVYEGEDQGDGSSIKVDLDRVQRAGVRTEAVQVRTLSRPVRAPGIAKPDERTMHSVTLRADAFIERLYVEETGAHVSKGGPLFRIYSPAMVNAQVDYRIADPTGAGAGRPSSIKGADQKLRNLKVPSAAIDEMRRSGQPVMSFDWPSPADGYVMKKNIVEGQMVRMGEEIFLIAGLDKVWVIAEVAEQDAGLVSVGQPAKVRFRALPTEIFEGRVTFILHELDAVTRTAKVRIELDNLNHRIKHEMYADVEIGAGAGDEPRVAVPNSAVLNSGKRQIVLVARGEGRFEPRAVTLGLRGEEYTEITKGIAPGEDVVVAANFLIDAESNLRSALATFMAGSGGRADKTDPPKEKSGNAIPMHSRETGQ